MEDKMFELMTKLYSEFSEFRKETNGKFDNIDSKFNRLESEVKGLRGDVTGIENDLGKKVDAAPDGYQQVYEKQLEHDKRFDDLENKLQKQDVEIRVIKGVG
jgi:peptidoglycan hydrolase CwlO-like protein